MSDKINLQSLLDIQPQKNMSDRIYEKICGLIRSGELEEGYVFPNETVLCEQLSVGRSTIREAYKALELSGYVTRSKRGTVVNGRSEILSAAPLKTIITNSSREDFVEFRLMLESQTAYLAALRANDDDIVLLTKIHKRFEKAQLIEAYEQMSDIDKEFHEAVAGASHNNLMVTAMTAVSGEWAQQTRNNFFNVEKNSPEKIEGITRTHKALIDAIADHDSERAREIMTEHISEVSK